MGRFEAEYRKLNSAQKNAVDIIHGPLLVIAGPGTGKTQLLSLRVANILKKTDVNPNNILCLTYTDSGKSAMQARLKDFLGNEAKRVEVHTFHSFGTRLITRFPDYFPELSRFRPADDLTLYETLHTCMERLPRSNSLSKQSYGQFVYQIDAKDRISQLKRAGITPEESIKKAEDDLAWCKSSGREIAKVFQRAGRLSSKIIGFLSTELETIMEKSSTSGLGNICLDELRDYILDEYECDLTFRMSAFKKKWLVSDDGKMYFRPFDQLKKLLALSQLYYEYEAELKVRGLYDYDDMILFALEKLKNHPEFLAIVQETFQYILADEYQDTNAAQASIINIIANNPVNEGRPNVMVVGDDDQAIYGFQGALGDVLMDFRERWRDVQVVTLKENYRSTQRIIDSARNVITRGQNRLENYYEDIDKSLSTNTKYAEVSPIQFEASSPEAVVEKAVQVAKSSTNDKQLAIIATKHKYLRELADRLDASKVNYYYEGREDLLRDPSLKKLLLLSDIALAIKQKDYNRTNYLLPEIIASRLVNIPRIAAWKIALQAKAGNYSWWETLLNTKEPEAEIAAKTIRQLVSAINPKDASECLKEIAKQNHLRVVQKIRRLYEHAKAYHGRNDISLGELLRYAELCKQAGIALDHTIVKGNVHARVVLLSAHKSKGLEFDRVYLLHADNYTWFKEGGRRNNLVLPEGWKYLEPIATTIDDRLRLLYVVMTRAKQELALIKSSGQTEILPGAENIKVEQHVSEILEDYNLPEEQDWRTWYLPNNSKEKSQLKVMLKPILDGYRLSPSHLTTFIDISHGGPTAFFVSTILGIVEPVHPEAIFGSHVHKTLHFAQNELNKNGKLPTKLKIEKFIKQESPILDDNRAKDILDVVCSFIEHSKVLNEGGVGEYSFSNKNIKFNGLRLTGNVDNFFLKDGTLTITDFKTGRALNSWRISEDYYKQKLHRFRQQLLFYELLFRLSTDFDAVKKVVSKVAFIEPSRRDVYYEITLDAGTNERVKLEALIQAVWHKIISLEFPDISRYSKDLSGIEKFEEDLISKEI